MNRNAVKTKNTIIVLSGSIVASILLALGFVGTSHATLFNDVDTDLYGMSTSNIQSNMEVAKVEKVPHDYEADMPKEDPDSWTDCQCPECLQAASTQTVNYSSTSSYEDYSSEQVYSEDNPYSGNFKSDGVVYSDGTRYTWYSQNVLPGGGLTELNNNGRHVDDNGFVCDGDGYIAVASNDYAQGTVVDTPFGKGKVYDSGCDSGTIDIYTNY